MDIKNCCKLPNWKIIKKCILKWNINFSPNARGDSSRHNIEITFSFNTLQRCRAKPNPRGIGHQTSHQKKTNRQSQGVVDRRRNGMHSNRPEVLPCCRGQARPVPRPLQYHARTEHMLPRNLNTMQDKIDNLTEYTDNHLMSINTKKMKAVLCNSSRKWDFITDQNIQREDRNEMLNEIKVVGFILRNNMKKYSNTSYIRGKAY